MKRTKDAKRKPRTHFEQIPLEIVKKITDGATSKAAEVGPDNMIIELASRKTEPYIDVTVQPDGRRFSMNDQVVTTPSAQSRAR